MLGIVAAQMLITFSFALLGSSNQKFGSWCAQLWVQIVACLLLIFVMCVLVCSKE